MRCAIIPCTHSLTPSFHDVLCNYSFHDVLCIRQECYHSFHDVLCSYSFHDVLCIRQECSHSFHDVLCNYSLHGCIRQECYHSFHSHRMSLSLSLYIYIYRKYLAQGQGIRPIPHDQETLSHGARLSVHVSTHERNYVFCYLHAYIWLQI